MLPNVKINFGQGGIGTVAPMEDGVAGLLATAVAVSGKFELGKAYLLVGLEDLETLGVTSGSTGANANLYKCVKDFYEEAGNGSKLWVMGVPDTVTIDEMVDKSGDYAIALVEAAKGAIRILMVKVSDASSYSPTVTGGIDSKVMTAAMKAQALAEHVTESLYAPLMVLLEGRHYSGTASDLTSLSTHAYNRVGIVIGDSEVSSTGAAVGLVAGRLAAIPVQRSLARVRNGAIKTETMYIGGVAAELGKPEVVHDAGYICPRTFVGKSGYYWADDMLATGANDDYQLIPRRRVVDKAYRIAYQTLVEELAEEISVNAEGGIAAPLAKSIEAKVESAIANGMTADGNLGVDPSDANDQGVMCEIDTKQNIVKTSKLKVKLRVKPYGYAKFIEVDLGFSTEAN